MPAYAGHGAHMPMFLAADRSQNPRRSPAAVAASGPLAAGVRAGPGLVGYLGSQGALTVLNPADSLTAVNALGWQASWESAVLVVEGANVTIDHYRINATVWITGSSPTVTNCVVRPPANSTQALIFPVEDGGLFTVTDTTVIGDTTGAGYVGAGIRSDSQLNAIRCDVSGTGDGIHMLMTQGSTANAKISQCYVHDQDFSDEEQHCDGIQIFNPVAAAGHGYGTVEHCYVARTISDLGTPMSSGMTCGGETAQSLDTGTMVINNNYFQSGLLKLRLNEYLTNCVVTNNDIGPLYASEVGLIGVEQPSSIATWSNNRDSTGSTIPQP